MPDHEPKCTGQVQCSKCKQYKPALAFATCKQHSNGLESQCRDCRSEYHKVHRRKNKLIEPIVNFDRSLQPWYKPWS